MAQLVDRAVGDHRAPVHDDDTPGAVAELGKRVRRKNHRRACGAPGLDDVVEIEPKRRVEAGGRLVQQQNLWFADQRLGQTKPLAHALGVGATGDGLMQTRGPRGRATRALPATGWPLSRA